MSRKKIIRQLSLTACLLNHHYPVRFDELQSELETFYGPATGAPASSERRFERDFNELIALGVPLGRLPNPDHARQFLYFIEKESNWLSRRSFTAEEWSALTGFLMHLQKLDEFPLKQQARSALLKCLASGSTSRDEPLIVYHSLHPEMSDWTEAITDAIQNRQSLTIRYHSLSQKNPEEREVHPYGLLFIGGVEYLVAWCTRKTEFRQFRLSRIIEMQVENNHFTRRQDFTLENWLHRDRWNLGNEGRERVIVRFDDLLIPQVKRQIRRYLPSSRPDEGEYHLLVENRNELIRWVLQFGRHASIIEPVALRDVVSQRLQRALGRYRMNHEPS